MSGQVNAQKRRERKWGTGEREKGGGGEREKKRDKIVLRTRLWRPLYEVLRDLRIIPYYRQ